MSNSASSRAVRPQLRSKTKGSLKEPSASNSTIAMRVTPKVRSQVKRLAKLLRGRPGEKNSSLSDAAKLYFNIEVDDDRLESALLLEHPAGTLRAIRQKIEDGAAFSRAEVIVLGEYAQRAFTQASRGNVSTNSLRAVLLALAGIRTHRDTAEPDLDVAYYGMLAPGAPAQELDAVRSDPRHPDELLSRRISDLESSRAPRCVSRFEARCLFFAIRNEKSVEGKALNAAISGVLWDLYRLAARGHWLATGTPIHAVHTDSSRSGPIADAEFPLCYFGGAQASGFSARFSVVHGDLRTSFESKPRSFTYVIPGFPAYAEFLLMFRSVTPEAGFVGQFFSGFCEARQFTFRDQHSNLFRFTEEEWRWTAALFEQQNANAANSAILEEMQLAFGVL